MLAITATKSWGIIVAISIKFKDLNEGARIAAVTVVLVSLVIVAFSLPRVALAQTGSSGALLEEIVTTARKKSAAESVQDVPVAVNAYGAQQLDALFVKKVEDLSYVMPNV